MREALRGGERVVADRPPRDRFLSVAVIGCGLIGGRRAEVVRASHAARLLIAADSDEGRVRAVAENLGCEATVDWREVVARDDVDTVIVSTTNNWLAPIAIAALEHGKHVLVEKPMARTRAEAEGILRAAGCGGSGGSVQGAGRPFLGVGFNHRYHPAIRTAHDLAAQGAIGDLICIRCRYGHGGRLGYQREWRANPEVAGGGELLDQGIHGIDLFRWFLGEFTEAFGFTATYVWGLDEAPEPVGGHPGAGPKAADDCVEDNGFALFRTATGQVASLHASWTQWKNLFSFEVFGREGYLVTEGLGGSYGPERLTWGRRRPRGGPPDEQAFEFPGPDGSWQAEWDEFASAVRDRRKTPATAYDGWQALRMVEAVYASARIGKAVKL